MARSTLAESVLVDAKDSFGNPLSEANLSSLYDRIRHLLTDKHRKYLDQIKNGEGAIDPEIEVEMNLRLASVMTQNAVEWSLKSGKLSRDLPTLFSEVRQSATAVEDIRRKRDVTVKAEEAVNDEFDPLRATALGRIRSFADPNTKSA